MAFLVEQAGGLASTGRERILDLDPGALHQRVPVILGSRSEVERIERYHREYDAGTDQPYISPLFNERSLYRPEARCGFNRWTQHTRSCVSGRSVADEAKNADLLYGKPEGDHVGALAQRRVPPEYRRAV